MVGGAAAVAWVLCSEGQREEETTLGFSPSEMRPQTPWQHCHSCVWVGVLRWHFCPTLAICLLMDSFDAEAADQKTSLPYPLLALLRFLWVKISLIKEVRERLHFTLTSGKFTVQTIMLKALRSSATEKERREEGREEGRHCLTYWFLNLFAHRAPFVPNIC